jgi:hypothetical protein
VAVRPEVMKGRTAQMRGRTSRLLSKRRTSSARLLPPFFVRVIGHQGIDSFGDFSNEPLRVCLLDMELAEQLAEFFNG